MRDLNLLPTLFAAAALTVTGCGDPQDSPTPDTPEPEWTYATVVQGPLVADAQAVHDPIAAGGQSAAQSAGDLSHDALVSTPLLGTPADQFLGVDTWDDAQAMGDFYADPAFGEGLMGMFSGPPTITAYVQRHDWHGWGALDAADGGDFWFVVAQGTLAEPAEEAITLHDQLAAGGEEAAKAAGDVAHVVFLGLDDPQRFMAIDVWRDDAQLEAFYANPDFQAGFAALFAEPPTVQVYRSTDWHQW